MKPYKKSKQYKDFTCFIEIENLAFKSPIFISSTDDAFYQNHNRLGEWEAMGEATGFLSDYAKFFWDHSFFGTKDKSQRFTKLRHFVESLKQAGAKFQTIQNLGDLQLQYLDREEWFKYYKPLKLELINNNGVQEIYELSRILEADQFDFENFLGEEDYRIWSYRYFGEQIPKNNGIILFTCSNKEGRKYALSFKLV